MPRTASWPCGGKKDPSIELLSLRGAAEWGTFIWRAKPADRQVGDASSAFHEEARTFGERREARPIIVTEIIRLESGEVDVLFYAPSN